MLVLSPTVTFGAFTFADIANAAISRTPSRTVTEFGDLGPHVAFADVPEYQTTLRLVGRVHKDDLAVPTPGQQATLKLVTSAEGSDRPRKQLSATCTLLSVRYDLSEHKGCMRTLDFVAISDGQADPFTLTEV